MSAEEISLCEFLEEVPPGVTKKISDLTIEKMRQGRLGGVSSPTFDAIKLPAITLFCDSAVCGGQRTFYSYDNPHTLNKGRFFATYVCKNCGERFKTFALSFSESQSTAFKYGEKPAFGPPTPARALRLIEGDRDLFLKGRRCESQGLGVGAFTYYRRVIENQRDRIFSEIIRVIKGTDPTNGVIQDLEAAKGKNQFSVSVDAIKHALPASLLINGENPLKLLHSALSEGVHAMSDDDCLTLATAVRTVLFEFSDRLAQTLRDDAKLAEAVNRLTNRKK